MLYASVIEFSIPRRSSTTTSSTSQSCAAAARPSTRGGHHITSSRRFMYLSRCRSRSRRQFEIIRLLCDYAAHRRRRDLQLNKRAVDLVEEEHFDIVRRRRPICSRLCPHRRMLGPDDTRAAGSVWDYGLNIGMVQIVEDLLDFTGEE